MEDCEDMATAPSGRRKRQPETPDFRAHRFKGDFGGLTRESIGWRSQQEVPR